MKTKSASQTAPKPFWKNAILLAITALALSASPGSRAAALCGCLRYWDNLNTGNWFDPSNWCPYQDFVPGCGGPICPIDGGTTEADINNGGMAQITTNTQTAYACEVFLGKDSGQSGSLSVDHGTLNQCNDMFVGYYGKGTLSIKNGGSVSTLAGASIAAASGSNGVATVDGTNSTWTVTIGGGGAVLRVGGILNGGGGTGLLTITNGGLVTADSVHVYPSGTLTGNAKVSTTSGTTVEGTLSPNWTLTIGGDLTFSGPAITVPTMQCNVTPANLNSVDAEVTGRATLTGHVSVTMTGTFTPGTTYTLLNADVGVSGTFSTQSINFPPGQNFTPKIIYDTHQVKLYLEPNNPSGF